MIWDNLAQQIQPEDRELGQYTALVRDWSGQHVVESGKAVGGGNDQKFAGGVNVADLASRVGLDARELRFKQGFQYLVVSRNGDSPQPCLCTVVNFSTLVSLLARGVSSLQMVLVLRREWRKEQYHTMNWDRVEGNWKQLKGKAREKWGKLTDSDFEQIAGKKDQLIGRIQERYGITREEAQKQADEWAKVQSLDEQQAQMHTSGKR